MSGQTAQAHDCGTCIACCYALSFNAEEGLKKKAGDMCPHCTGSGCGIYETRFRLCRLFLCAWRKMPALSEDWRPDKSGVMLMEVFPEELPEAYRAAGLGLEFLVLTDETALTRPALIDYVATLVSRKVGVYMSMIGGPKTLMNQFLEALVAVGDRAGLTAMLLHIYGLHRQALAQGLIGPDRKSETH